MASGLPVLTAAQYQRLLIIADPTTFAMTPGRRDWSPLLRRGWVAAVAKDDGSGYLPPLQITTSGLRALAAAADRYGLPEWHDEANPPRQLKEHPQITRLKEQLVVEKEQRLRAERDARHLRYRSQQISRLVEDCG